MRYPTQIVVPFVALTLPGQAQPPARARRPPPVMVAPEQTRNGSSEDASPRLASGSKGRILDADPPGISPKGSNAAAVRQNFLLDQAARSLAGGTRLPDDPTITQMILSPTIDPQTGLVKGGRREPGSAAAQPPGTAPARRAEGAHCGYCSGSPP